MHEAVEAVIRCCRRDTSVVSCLPAHGAEGNGIHVVRNHPLVWRRPKGIFFLTCEFCKSRPRYDDVFRGEVSLGSLLQLPQ
jgi:hypothetical protein